MSANRRVTKDAGSWLGLLLGMLVICGCGQGTVAPSAVEPVGEEADLARRILILDTHIDTPYRLRRSWSDLTQAGEGEFDYPKARQGGLDAAFMAIYVPADYQAGGAREFADRLIDLVESLEEASPEAFRVVRSPAEVEGLFASGRVALAMGIENGAAIEGDLTALRHFRDRGVNYITLTHSRANLICDSSYDAHRPWGGLSPFGREVVREMNRLGIMVDISHVTDEAAYQVLQLSSAPVIASHSSCRHFTPGWERNLSDELIRAVGSNRGVVQINFGAPFIDDAYRRASDPRFRKFEQFLKENALPETDPRAQAYRRELAELYPVPEVTVAAVADHIDRVVQLAGIDHVGFGSDFDGVDGALPVGLRDVSQYPNLIQELVRRGYSESEIAKIASGNLLRVWREVQAKP